MSKDDAKPNWQPFTADQRMITRRPGFDWNARIQMWPGVAVFVHDAYVAGRGQLEASLLGIFTMASMHDLEELSRGELMRFFAKAAWYPTALLPSQGVVWTAIDDNAATATLTDAGVSLTMTFRFSADGLIDTVRAEARGRTVGKITIQTPWECKLSNYVLRDGIRVPLDGEVMYILPDGSKPYFRGNITSITFEYAQ
jgi:hypothetical protein